MLQSGSSPKDSPENAETGCHSASGILANGAPARNLSLDSPENRLIQKSHLLFSSIGYTFTSMNESRTFSSLRKILKLLGLSEAQIDELITRIQEWLLDDQTEKTGAVQYPYHLRDDFLSPAELNFYRVLQTAVSNWATILVKVSLGDLFYAQTGDFGQNQAYRNKIDRKHVDFLLCDPHTMRPILGIELDDKSHQRTDRQKRDRFVDKVFVAARLPLVHIPVKNGYPTEKLNQYLQQKAGPLSKSVSSINEPVDGVEQAAAPVCPKCGAKMVQRTAKTGTNKGKVFWGCSNYPRCRGIVHDAG
mgnify:CR=1 FL=1